MGLAVRGRPSPNQPTNQPTPSSPPETYGTWGRMIVTLHKGRDVICRCGTRGGRARPSDSDGGLAAAVVLRNRSVWRSGRAFETSQSSRGIEGASDQASSEYLRVISGY